MRPSFRREERKPRGPAAPNPALSLSGPRSAPERRTRAAPPPKTPPFGHPPLDRRGVIRELDGVRDGRVVHAAMLEVSQRKLDEQRQGTLLADPTSKARPRARGPNESGCSDRGRATRGGKASLSA